LGASASSKVCIKHGSLAFYLLAKLRQNKKMKNFEVIFGVINHQKLEKGKKKEKWSDHYYIYF
jgi:hypothetical protein